MKIKFEEDDTRLWDFLLVWRRLYCGLTEPWNSLQRFTLHSAQAIRPRRELHRPPTRYGRHLDHSENGVISNTATSYPFEATKVTALTMGSIPGQFPISLRPWPLKDDKTVQLSSLISRIDSERGSFREISEEGLIEEVQKDEAEIGACRDNNGIEVEDVEEEPDRVKELTRAQGEILGQLE